MQYQLSFEEKKDWSSFYAPGPEIRKYLEGVVQKYKLMRYIKLSHEITGARYNELTGKWHIRVRRTDGATGKAEEFEDIADVFVNATGPLSRWNWPDIEGLKDFKGELHHSASFDPSEKTWQEVADGWKDKKVAVIGIVSTSHSYIVFLRIADKVRWHFVLSTGLQRASDRRRTPAACGQASKLRSREDLDRSASCRRCLPAIYGT